MFDYIVLNGPSIKLATPDKLYVKDLKPAGYELQNGNKGYSLCL